MFREIIFVHYFLPSKYDYYEIFEIDTTIDDFIEIKIDAWGIYWQNTKSVTKLYQTDIQTYRIYL